MEHLYKPLNLSGSGNIAEGGEERMKRPKDGEGFWLLNMMWTLLMTSGRPVDDQANRSNQHLNTQH